jgi:hypothetical protein
MTVKSYQIFPDVVEAIQYDGLSATITEIEEFVGFPVTVPDPDLIALDEDAEDTNFILITIVNPDQSEPNGELPIYVNDWIVKQFDTFLPYVDDHFSAIATEITE